MSFCGDVFIYFNFNYFVIIFTMYFLVFDVTIQSGRDEETGALRIIDSVFCDQNIFYIIFMLIKPIPFSSV